MVKESKISIILPVSGGLEYLKKTIPAIKSLNYSNYEIIIADNSGLSEIYNFFKNMPGISYIRTNRHSKTIASNKGAKLAQGEYLLFLDGDALIKDKNLLKKLVATYNSNKEACFSISFRSGNNQYEGRGGRLFIPTRQLRLFLTGEKNKNILDYPQGFAFFLKKNVWDELGGYDERIAFGCEEIDIGFKLKINNIPCLLFDNSSLIDLGVPQGEVSNIPRNSKADAKKFGSMIYGKIYFIRKYYKLIDLFLVFPILFIYHLFTAIKKSLKTQSTFYIFYFINAYRSYFKIRIK